MPSIQRRFSSVSSITAVVSEIPEGVNFHSSQYPQTFSVWSDMLVRRNKGLEPLTVEGTQSLGTYSFSSGASVEAVGRGESPKVHRAFDLVFRHAPESNEFENTVFETKNLENKVCGIIASGDQGFNVLAETDPLVSHNIVRFNTARGRDLMDAIHPTLTKGVRATENTLLFEGGNFPSRTLVVQGMVENFTAAKSRVSLLVSMRAGRALDFFYEGFRHIHPASIDKLPSTKGLRLAVSDLANLALQFSLPYKLPESMRITKRLGRYAMPALAALTLGGIAKALYYRKAKQPIVTTAS